MLAARQTAASGREPGDEGASSGALVERRALGTPANAPTAPTAGAAEEIARPGEPPFKSTRGRLRYPSPAWGASTSGGPEILFTFDDGPHEKFTPKVLDALAAHGIQGIFYVTGWRLADTGSASSKGRLAVFERTLREGHAIGNHTVNHARMCTVPSHIAAQELDDNNAIITERSGMPPAYYRTPYGSRCHRLDQLLEERTLVHMHWDLDPHEYLHHDPGQVKQYLIRHLSKLKGRAVILLHDTQSATARALPVVLDWLAAENQRRHAKGQPVIRVLSSWDIVKERDVPAFWDGLAAASRRLGGVGERVAEQLGVGGRRAKPL